MKIKITKGVLISASVQELAHPEVVSAIGERLYNQIKREDEHPQFVKLEVGKQGEAGGAVILGGIKRLMKKIWSATRIKELARWLGAKIPLFVNHNADNSTEGRRKVGELLKGWTEEGDDGSRAVAIGYIPSTNADVQEAIRKRELDICSMEADLEFSIKSVGRLFVEKIKKLTAVALGSSSKGMMPGFKTAGVVAVVQEMSSTEEVIRKALEGAGIGPDEYDIVDDDDGKKKRIGRRKVQMSDDLTLEEVQLWIKRRHITPDTIYSLEEMLKVKGVEDAVENEATERLEKSEKETQEEADRLTKELEDKDNVIADKDKEIEDKNKEVGDKQKEVEQAKAALQPFMADVRQEEVTALVKKSPLLKDVPQEKADFVASHVRVPTDIDLADDKVGETIDKAVQDQIDDIEKHGIKFEKSEDPPAAGGGGAGGGGGGSGGKGDEGVLPQYGDDNPLTPEDQKSKKS